MASNIVRSGGNALAAYGGVNPFAEAGRGAETGAYLKFNGNKGDLTYGSDDDALPEGSLLVFDLNTYAQGWICWKDSEVVEERLQNIIEGRPEREVDLPDHGPFDDADDGWREAGSISAILLEHGSDAEHEDVGLALLFKTSTGGAVRALKKLSLAYGRVFMTKPGQLPIVEVTVDEYTPKNKKHGKKYAINFKIVDWITEDELAGLSQAAAAGDDDYEPEDEPAPEPEPAIRRRAAPAAAAEPAARRRAAPAAAEEPATRRRAAPAPAPVEEPADEPEEEEEAPAPAPATRRRAAPAPVEEPADEPEDDGDVAPAPRGRSPGRGAPPANARVRRFAQ